MAGPTVLLLLAACATTADVTDGYPNQRAILKKSKAELLSCAGAPLREFVHDGLTILTYFSHPPGMDRSTVTAKSTVPVPHYGCWADVSLEHGVVSTVRYRSETGRTAAPDLCEAIFDPCS